MSIIMANKTINNIFIGNKNNIPKAVTKIFAGGKNDIPYLVWSKEKIEIGKIYTITESGIWIVPEGVSLIDVFLVGGGGGGAGSTYGANAYYAGGGGGGGGHTKTVLNIAVTEGQQIKTIIGYGGEGGVPVNSFTGNNGTDGGTTSFGIYSADGGKSPNMIPSNKTTSGDGGSGGGQGGEVSGSTGVLNKECGGNGGTDGSNGYVNNHMSHAYAQTSSFGIGQQTTTRAFGENEGLIYACGGDGGNAGKTTTQSGGIVKGGYYTSDDNTTLNGEDAMHNTGNGGGGGGRVTHSQSDLTYGHGGKGGSGIILVRIKG